MLSSYGDIFSKDEYLSFERHENVTCPAHLHLSLEIVCVKKGTVIMTVGSEKRELCQGQATFVKPFESHFFSLPDKMSCPSECMVMVFSPSVADSFYEAVKNMRAEKSVCTLDKNIFELCSSRFPNDGKISLLEAKAILYPLCADLYRKCSWKTETYRIEKSYISAVRYVAEHFRDGITLESTAFSLGMNAAYLSRVFRQNSHMTFTEYLNGVRCSYAAKKLCDEEDESSISEIAFDSGFGSIRSFNRVFRNFYGMTPGKMSEARNVHNITE